MTNYIDAFKTRYAVKRMTGEKINDEKIHRVIDAINLSPTSLGLQPFQLLVIRDEKTKKDILPMCHNQAQIVECDTLILFLSFLSYSPEYIDKYIFNLAQRRNTTIENLLPYKQRIQSYLDGAEANNNTQHWIAKQSYIALGFGLAACAMEQLDSCPIEGFDANKINDHFKLKENNLSCSVMLAIGKKDIENDWNFKNQKYRKPLNELIFKL